MPKISCIDILLLDLYFRVGSTMARDEDAFDNPPAGSDFVPVVVARSVEDAEMFRELLEDHDIPSILGTEENIQETGTDSDDLGEAMTHGVPVLVPEGLLDEAGEIIADREDFEELSEEDDFDEEDEDFSLDDGMTEEAAPLLGDEDFLAEEEPDEDLDDEEDEEK